MKINGASIDTDMIAKGLFEIMIEDDKASVLSHGMLPMRIMMMAERSLEKKIIALAAKQYGIPEDAARCCVDKEKLEKITKPVILDISAKILALAKV